MLLPWHVDKAGNTRFRLQWVQRVEEQLHDCVSAWACVVSHVVFVRFSVDFNTNICNSNWPWPLISLRFSCGTRKYGNPDVDVDPDSRIKANLSTRWTRQSRLFVRIKRQTLADYLNILNDQRCCFHVRNTENDRIMSLIQSSNDESRKRTT